MFDIAAIIRLPDGRCRQAVVADGDRGDRTELVDLLRRRGFDVIEVADGLEALDRIGNLAPQVALMRRDMPACDGERAALLARLLYPATRIILTTSRPPAYTPAYTPDDDPGAGIFPVLRHPFDPDQLDHCLGDLTA